MLSQVDDKGVEHVANGIWHLKGTIRKPSVAGDIPCTNSKRATFTTLYSGCFEEVTQGTRSRGYYCGTTC